MLNFTRADSKCERTKCAVCRRMRVTAHDGHTRLSDTKLRANHMHNSLLGITQGVKTHPKLRAIGAQCIHLRATDGVSNREIDPHGGHIVVLGGDGEVGTTNLAATCPQTIKCLRTCHLMHKVQVDIDEVWFTFGTAHDMVVPYLFSECATSHEPTSITG